MSLWSFGNIQAKVRNLTGRPSTEQISADSLKIAINHYYQNVFPIEINVTEFEGYTELSATNGTGSYDIPSTVLTINPPITVKDSDDKIYPMDLFIDERRFFELFPDDCHDEEDERERPVAMLVYGRKIYLRPVPDASYTVKYYCRSQTPTALSDEQDTVSDDMWGPCIAYGTAIEILQEAGENDEADELKDMYNFYMGLIDTKYIKQIPLGARALPRF